MSLLKLQIEEHEQTISRLTASIEDHKKSVAKLKIEDAIANPPPPFSSRMVMQIHELECHHHSGTIIADCHFTTPSRAGHSAKLDLTAFFKASGFEITPLFSAFKIDFKVTPILRQDIVKTLKEEEP